MAAKKASAPLGEANEQGLQPNQFTKATKGGKPSDLSAQMPSGSIRGLTTGQRGPRPAHAGNPGRRRACPEDGALRLERRGPVGRVASSVLGPARHDAERQRGPG